MPWYGWLILVIAFLVFLAWVIPKFIKPGNGDPPPPPPPEKSHFVLVTGNQIKVHEKDDTESHVIGYLTKNEEAQTFKEVDKGSYKMHQVFVGNFAGMEKNVGWVKENPDKMKIIEK